MSPDDRTARTSLTPRSRPRAWRLSAALGCALALMTAGAAATAQPAAGEGPHAIGEERLALKERVVFDAERARVRSSGTPALEAVSILWRLSPEWERLVVEGHADSRGPAEFNQWLSELRAARVRDALIAAGVPADRIEVVGYGATRPLDPGAGERAHRRNRRVEFVVVHPPRGVERRRPVATAAR